MAIKDAVDWHTQNAVEFDNKYCKCGNFIERYTVWTEIIDRYSNPDFRVMDLGCGSGVFTLYLADKNREILGLDASSEMLKIARAKQVERDVKNVEFMECDINVLQQAAVEKVDMVVCSSVLEYLDDLDQSLAAIAGCLRPDGVFILSMPNRRSLYRMAEPIAYRATGHPKYYEFVKNVCTLDEIERRLKKCGFNMLESHFYGATPVLSKLLRPAGMAHFSEKLFVVVARLTA